MARAGYQRRRDLERAIERDKQFLSTAGWSLKKTTEYYSEAAGFEYGTGTVRDVLVSLGLYTVKSKGKAELAAAGADDAGLYVTAASYLELVRRVDEIASRHSALSIESSNALSRESRRINELLARQAIHKRQIEEWGVTFSTMVQEVSALRSQIAELAEAVTELAAE